LLPWASSARSAASLRDLDCDEDEAAFEARLKRIAEAPAAKGQKAP